MPLFGKKKKEKERKEREREGSAHKDDKALGVQGASDNASSDDVPASDSRFRTKTEVLVRPAAGTRPTFLPSHNVTRSNTSAGQGVRKPADLRARPSVPLSSTNAVLEARASRPLSLDLQEVPTSTRLIPEKQNGVEEAFPKLSLREDGETQDASEEDALREALKEVTGCEKTFRWQGVPLSLPAVVSAPAAKPRTLNLQRREQGDFGFTLRQPAGEARSTVKGSFTLR